MEPRLRNYLDTFEHAFDEKGRITVPAEWRKEGFEVDLVVIPSGDKCLKVYPASWLAQQQGKLDRDGAKIDDPRRQAFEALSAISQSAGWDLQGRMMVKEGLRTHAGIKRQAVLVGCSDHFKIWSAERHTKQPRRAMTLEEAAKVLGI